MPDARSPPGDWHLYVLRTGAGTLYTGIARDVARRLREHGGGGARAARCLRGRGPLTLVYQVRLGERSLALRAEFALKRLPHGAKAALAARKPCRESLLRQLQLAPSAENPRPAAAP